MARVALLLITGFLIGCPLHAQPLPESTRLPHPPGIALVLSGGGAKGFSHIGVLEVLDSAHVPIDLIVGTSIGAAIGGLYAAGYSPQDLEKFATTTDWPEILGLEDETHRAERIMSQKDADRALLSLRFKGFLHPVIPQAISSGQRLTMLLNSMVLRAPSGVPNDFLRDLRVPFAAVTTDIVRGERRLLTSGDLTEALRASATLPLRFSPLPQDSTILMDGGLMANIPVDVARGLGASQIIVSNATAPLRSREELNTPWDVADQVISLMMQRQYASELLQANIIITPEATQHGDYDAISIAEAIESGRVAARAMLTRIAALAATDPPATVAAGEPVLDSLVRLRVITRGRINYDPDYAKAWIGHQLRSESLGELEHATIQDYRSRGFSLVRIDSVVLHPSSRSADLFVDAGSIANIVVRGVGMTESSLATGELPFAIGDVFRATQADRALKNLIGTGLFDFAILQISYDSLWPGTRLLTREDTMLSPPSRTTLHGPTVLVTVHARASNVLRLGVLADNEFGAQFSVELANENIAGSGVEYSLMGNLGPASRNASLTLEAPRLLRGFALLEAAVYTGYLDIPSYSLQTITEDNRISSTTTDAVREERDLGVRLKAGGQVERLGAITGEVRSEHQRWFSVRDLDPVVNTLLLNAVRGELIIDSRNDASYPHDGTFVRAYAETGQPVAGGSPAYTKLYLDVEQAIPVSGLHAIVPRFRIGFADAALPQLEQFNLGGMESFYGLNAYELRGKQMIAGSITYQIEIPHVLYFPTFVSFRYDLGETWPEPEEIKWETLVDGIGAQVGLKTPIGLARFGIGENFRFVQLGSHRLAWNTPRFYFSIGSNL
ncbi:MAG: patatin-like phospholipase family protein [Bacteroidota bacterium]|nr:patatin-like phospholipase family protein [Bacteroidota bacterium]MDP4232922.1 patatin-like phospholipase family protein [Bacteroidota bacterium]MDP4286869.1 patatin-like phospholipase family protein [Bacteroidota bacterium]